MGNRIGLVYTVTIGLWIRISQTPPFTWASRLEIPGAGNTPSIARCLGPLTGMRHG